MSRRLILLLCLLCWNAAIAAPAPQPESAADWAWDQISHHHIADFNLRCGKTLDPIKDTDARWADPCRGVSADDLAAMILRDDVPREGVRLVGVRVVGDLDLEDAEVKHPLWIQASRIDGSLNLRRAELDKLLLLDRTRVTGALVGDGLRAQEGIFLRDHADVKGEVLLADARIDDDLDLDGSTFEGDLVAADLQADHIFMRGRADFKHAVNLYDARTTENVELDDSNFENGLNADRLQAGNDLLIKDAKFSGPLVLIAAQIGDGLFLNGSDFISVNLSEAVIRSEFRLSEGSSVAKWHGGAALRPPALNLRNAEVGILQDSLAALPASVDLDNFSFVSLGGAGATTEEDPSDRTADEWLIWLEKNVYARKAFNPQPYANLSKFLAGVGRQSDADTITFASQQAERVQDWRRGDIWPALWLTALWLLCGYGVGAYSLFVLLWVAASVALGVVVLRLSPEARRHHLIWCVFACLERLLPVVTLYKGFSKFFSNRDGKNLCRWQVGFFCLYALWGWGLSLILIAAISGITRVQ